MGKNPIDKLKVPAPVKRELKRLAKEVRDYWTKELRSANAEIKKLKAELKRYVKANALQKAKRAAKRLFGDYWAVKDGSIKRVGTFGDPHLDFKEYGRGETWAEALDKARKAVKRKP